MDKIVEIINSQTTAFKINNKEYIFSENAIPKTKKATDILIAKNKDEKYIFKINHTKTEEEFELIKKTIMELNSSNFPTAKLVYCEYKDNKSYFIFEYIKGSKITKIENHLQKIAELTKQFYEITKKIPLNPNLTFNSLAPKIRIKTQSPILHDIFNKALHELLRSSHTQLIICDINSSNFIENQKGLYMIDFDEIFFCEIEFDLADLFTDYFKTNKGKIAETIKNYRKYISEFKEYDISIQKILDYIILILISELTPNAPQSENHDKMETLKFILKNRKILLKHLDSSP
jgi:thiamine kinase-like enzyme